MSVTVPNRKMSKTEFDNLYYGIYSDAVNLVRNHLGAKGDTRTEMQGYIFVMSRKILDVVADIGTHIRIANSIFPQFRTEVEERRIHQEKAIGLCYDLLTKYQLAMKTLKVPDNKFVEEIKRVSHEISCLKGWRSSDNKRFVHIG